MGEQAIYALASTSVPIQSTSKLFNNADYKKMQALRTSAELADNLRGNVNEYYKNRAEFLTKLEEKRKAEAEADAKKRLTEIENMALWSTDDPYKLKQGQDKLASFFRFAHFNKSIDTAKLDGAYGARKLQRQTGERLAKLETGQEAGSSRGPVYLGMEYQPPGERDFLV